MAVLVCFGVEDFPLDESLWAVMFELNLLKGATSTFLGIELTDRWLQPPGAHQSIKVSNLVKFVQDLSSEARCQDLEHSLRSCTDSAALLKTDAEQARILVCGNKASG